MSKFTGSAIGVRGGSRSSSFGQARKLRRRRNGQNRASKTIPCWTNGLFGAGMGGEGGDVGVDESPGTYQDDRGGPRTVRTVEHAGTVSFRCQKRRNPARQERIYRREIVRGLGLAYVERLAGHLPAFPFVE